jgi:eukaryotic-like serine/threonine-protein kinase
MRARVLASLHRMAAAPQDDPRIGSVLVERYQILERLSAGAMGVVYRAERLKLGRIVAVKFLHSAFAFSDDFTKRFDLEARTMSRLDHPHCVSVIDFGVADAPFIVMDFVTGTTLRELVASGPLPPARASTLRALACSGDM